ncbi:Pro-cathepsin H [Thelohanellus kitauei]|uniref:Pro-cathepsin H n=1 Tax=Thelohanellus kitauei TaxID=669202 RepID=A0A0C2MEV1_THEKT|nr:Pro-cathepsin H [Thelohanellus kitauei]
MKGLFLVFTLVILSESKKHHHLSFEERWNEHKVKYSLEFDGPIEKIRKRIFRENLEYIKRHNSKNSELRLKMNQFGHLLQNEMPLNSAFKKIQKPLKRQSNLINDLPVRAHMDWRTFGVVSQVKNQGSCGSCYAFSAIGAIESQYAIKTGRMTLLSEQDVVDCSLAYNNSACGGGQIDNVFKFSMEKGLVNQTHYPYVGEDEICRRKGPVNDFKIKYYVDIPAGDEHQMIRVLSFVGPVSIAIDADFKDFMFYESGIIRSKSCDPENVNHAVLAVGYSLAGKKPYFIVKNSFGVDWGESGFFRISLGENMCGIASTPSYPVV